MQFFHQICVRSGSVTASYFEARQMSSSLLQFQARLRDIAEVNRESNVQAKLTSIVIVPSLFPVSVYGGGIERVEEGGAFAASPVDSPSSEKVGSRSRGRVCGSMCGPRCKVEDTDNHVLSGSLPWKIAWGCVVSLLR